MAEQNLESRDPFENDPLARDAKKGEPIAKFLENTSLAVTGAYVIGGIYFITQNEWPEAIYAAAVIGGVRRFYQSMYDTYKNYPPERKIRVINGLNSLVENLNPKDLAGKGAEKLDKIFSSFIPETYVGSKSRIRDAVSEYEKTWKEWHPTDKIKEQHLLLRIQSEVNYISELKPEDDEGKIIRDLNASAIRELIKKARKTDNLKKSQYLRLLSRRIFPNTAGRMETEKTKIDPVWVHDTAKKILHADGNLEEPMNQFVNKPPEVINI